MIFLVVLLFFIQLNVLAFSCDLQKMDKYELMYKIHVTIARSFPYKSDMENYNKLDFWTDLRKKGSGDCEDYAITKYLIAVNKFGFNKNDFKFVLVQLPNKKHHLILKYKDRYFDINGKDTSFKKDWKLITVLTSTFVEKKIL